MAPNEDGASELLEALRSARPVHIQMEAPAAFTLLGLLQLALRHPGVQSSTVPRGVAKSLASMLEQHLPADAQPHIAKGWNPDCDVPIGPTGQFPRGRLDSADRGELQMAVSADAVAGVIRIEFGTLVSEIAMEPELASEIGKSLIAKAGALGRG